jgi:hypothetical protein
MDKCYSVLNALTASQDVHTADANTFISPVWVWISETQKNVDTTWVSDGGKYIFDMGNTRDLNFRIILYTLHEEEE